MRLTQYQPFETAVLYLKGHHFQDALTQFKVILKDNNRFYPDILNYLYKQLNHQPIISTSLRLMIAELLLGNHEFNLAVDEVEENLLENQDSNASFLILQKIYQQQKESCRIREIFEQAFFSCKNHSSVIIDFLQFIYFAENDIDKSIRFYLEIIQYDKDNVVYHKNLLEMYLKNKQFDDGLSICNTILGISPYDRPQIILKLEEILSQVPNNFEARLLIIRLYLQQRQPDFLLIHLRYIETYFPEKRTSAIPIYKEALSIFPEMPELLVALSKSLFEIKEYTESVTHLRVAFEKTKFERSGLIDILKKILLEFPQQIMALLLLADIYFELNWIKESLLCIEQLIDIDDQELDNLEDKIHRCIQTVGFLEFGQYLLAKIDISRQSYDAARIKLEKLILGEYDFQVRLLKIKIFELELNLDEAQDFLLDSLAEYPFSKELHERLKKIHHIQNNERIESLLKNIDTSKDLQQKDNLTFDLGIQFLIKGSINQALNCFQVIVTNQSLEDKVQILMSRCFMELSRYDLAINHLKRVLERIQRSDIKLSNQVRYLLGMNYLLLGKIENATDYLDSILEYDINFPMIKELVTHYKQHSFIDLKGKSVVTFFSQTYPNSLSLCASLKMEVDGLHQIKNDYISVSFSFTHNNKGVDNILKENFKAAEDEFKLAIQMDPQLGIAYYNLGLLYLILKRFEESMVCFQHAQKYDPKMDVLYVGYGMLYFTQKNYLHAISYLQKAVELNPQNYLALLNLGDLYYEIDNLEQAFNCWKNALKGYNYSFIIFRRLCYLFANKISYDDWFSDFQFINKATLHDLLVQKV